MEIFRGWVDKKDRPPLARLATLQTTVGREINFRKLQAAELLVTQGDERINFRRPPRRNVTSDERHRDQQHGNSRERLPVGRADIKEQIFQQTGQRQRRAEPNQYADNG